MAHKWRDVRGTFSPEKEAEIRRRVEMTPVIMRLHQVREARNLTQTKLAKLLKVNQGAVSKLERRTDMYVSTLRSYLKAMGGELEIKAIFPDGEVIIDQFEGLAEDRDNSTA
ncbi:MAG TPA: XRE family transcriptional regulator [Acidobacteriaceae bacterium]|nr:XRE family transcriptional regulator [Acidobacteriaceae bacterium]